jgi:RNA 2',3'-cyclic 3'-phosphodiesterase
LTAAAPAAAAAEATRRLFFALWPDEAQRTALVHAAGKAVRACGGRPVPPENLHVTLCFLGSVPGARLAELGALARRVAADSSPRASPVVLDFECIEYWARPQLLCASAPAATQPGTLPAQGLARALRDAAAAIGFAPDLKPFRAHVTLVRKVVRAQSGEPIRPVRWQFDALALVESRTLPAGPLYSVVESYALVNAQKVCT